jgi:hypothetical protein
VGKLLVRFVIVLRGAYKQLSLHRFYQSTQCRSDQSNASRRALLTT